MLQDDVAILALRPRDPGGAIEIRHEAPGSPAAQALFARYMELVRDRLGPDFAPTETIFASEEVFAGPGAAWLVLYEGGAPVGCGGLRMLEPGVAEIKRMFVVATARGRGHGRRLLAELERDRARERRRSACACSAPRCSPRRARSTSPPATA